MSAGFEDRVWTSQDRGPQRLPSADQRLRGTIVATAVVATRRSRDGQRRARVAGGQRQNRATPRPRHRSPCRGNAMFFDPMYFLFILPGLGLSLWASARVKRTFNRYAKVWSRRGSMGAQAAVALLRGAGITDVQIVRAHGVPVRPLQPGNEEAGALRGRSMPRIPLLPSAWPRTRRGMLSSTRGTTRRSGCARHWCQRPPSARVSAMVPWPSACFWPRRTWYGSERCCSPPCCCSRS